ncbi:aspartic peptidase domain-containing protein [Suillus spraguei]|nr:aspartic peptidase domain-containing protein [Suillus spraguei]
MFIVVFLLTLFLAFSITGSSVEVRNSTITLPLTRRLNFSDSTIDFLQRDRARVAVFRGYNTHGRRAAVKSTFLDYRVAVGIDNLLLDTGSANTWVGADLQNEYVETVTSIITEEPVEVKYGNELDDSNDSFFSGIIYRDTVTLGVGLTVTNFKLGVASDWEGFAEGEDGILGIGPRELTRQTMLNHLDDTIPTFTDYLYDQGKILQHVVGIFFQPSTTNPESQFGEVTFGGTDNTKYIGEVAYTDMTATSPSSNYWGINQRITYGATAILSYTAGIVDTGATFLQIATDAFERYQAATGGTFDLKTGLLSITTDQYNALQPLNFHIGEETLTLTTNAQIWPRSLNDKLPGTGDPNAIYLIVTNIGAPTGRGDDFVLGYTFLQRFYSVYDGSNRRVGFAKTPFTDATTN